MKKHLLVKIAEKNHAQAKGSFESFTNNPKADDLITDLDNYPHAYVLACLMDRQITAERAWIIPYQIFKEIGSFNFNSLEKISRNNYIQIFNDKKLHRFNDTMADIFFKAIMHIKNEYDGNVEKIWLNNPSSASVVYRFMEFKGSGIKISTMATNILARRFKIPFSDYYSIDISPDVHVIRVMKRTGLVPKDSNNEMIIYKARELNPEFPGIIDNSCWEIGRNWCHPKNPNCNECIIKEECKKIIA